MTKNKGFTLIELMVVILIVAILAAVLAPMMTGRIRDAKWTEGKAGAGTIATAIRAFIAEHEGPTGNGVTIASGMSDFGPIGIVSSDLTGKYFLAADYSLTAFSYTAAAGETPASWTYTIQVKAPTGTPIGCPTTAHWDLDEGGDWSYAE